MATPHSPRARRLSRAVKPRELPRPTVALTTLVKGVGSFGFYRGSCDVTTQRGKIIKTVRLPVGIKLVREGARERDRKALMNEATCMAQFAHPNVLAIGGVVSTTEPMMIVHELYLGTLSEYLSDREVETAFLRKCAMEVCSGLVYLGSNAFVHWDVACRNIFLNPNQLCKIGNLGLEKQPDDPAPKGYYTSPLGKKLMRWSAPEYADTEATPRGKTSQEDVWAYGFFLYELMTQGKIPYGGKETWDSPAMYLATMEQVQTGSILPQPEGCPDDMYDVMVSCWELDPKQRPSFQKVKTTLTSQSALDELDFILSQATDLAIAEGKEHSDISLTKDEAEGISRPPSPLDEGTRTLIRDTAELREERQRRAQAEGKAPDAPGSPRPARKFKPTGFGSARRSKTPVINQEVVQRFTALFAEPGTGVPPP